MTRLVPIDSMSGQGHTPLSRLVHSRLTEHGISTREAAQRAQRHGEAISSAAIGQYRNGAHPKPTPRTLRALAAALDLPLDQLQEAAGMAEPLGPWTPPKEADQMNAKHRRHVSTLIKMLVETESGIAA